LTTGEAARLLNSSRQHVVDLCDRGELAFVTTGTHRRVRRGDLEALRTRTQKMTRDQRRSLWLAYAIAGRIVEDPQRARLLAAANLEQMAVASKGRPARWVAEWADLLSGPLERLLHDYTSHSPRGRELRQIAPFAGLLTDAERAAVLENWKHSD
jgi:excisionase family DNA binding protein